MLMDAYRDECLGIRIAYRTDGHLLNQRRMHFQSRLSTTSVHELLFADDWVLKTISEEDMQQSMDLFSAACENFGLVINTQKTVVMYQPSPNTATPPTRRRRKSASARISSVLSSCACVNFEAKYSKNYPNEAPIFEVRRPVDTIQRSLGGIMIFDLVSEVQIKLDEYSDAALEQAKQFEMQTTRALNLAEEEKRFHGTRVTVESFNEWNKAFIAEVQEKRALLEKKAAASQGVKRLTGREMFLRDDKFDESDLTFLEAEGGEIVEVDERLFVDIDDVDFEDEDLDRPVIAI
ncbi:RWD domain-containing protein 1 [Sparganum proliferum]